MILQDLVCITDFPAYTRVILHNIQYGTMKLWFNCQSDRFYFNVSLLILLSDWVITIIGRANEGQKYCGLTENELTVVRNICEHLNS